MNHEIAFATCEEEDQLLEILMDSNMEIAGDIQDHVVIKRDDEILGGGMLTETSPGVYHLIVFAVKDTVRNCGIGRLLLKEMVKTPWMYCKNCDTDSLPAYKVTTVAKGESAQFYEKIGFRACDFSDLAEPFCEQCIGCPDIKACNPVAMMYEA